MGLDNGIVIRDKNTNKEIEVCYWRKYWSLRNRIMNTLHINDEGGTEKVLSVEDISAIRKIIADFIQRVGDAAHNTYYYNCYYYDCGTASWDWSENHIGLKYSKDIERLTKLELMMKRGMKDNLEVIFYDSY